MRAGVRSPDRRHVVIADETPQCYPSDMEKRASMGGRAARIPILLALSCVLGAGCDRGATGRASEKRPTRPNILFIVWDTVRADRLSLYGHVRKTTPFLDRWARDARIYENCITVGSTTVPSHASMFTGLMPTEHRTTNEPGTHILPDAFDTLAELLKTSGYDAYAFVANPYLEQTEGKLSLMQGFDRVDYPWDQRHRARALRITLGKIKTDDHSCTLAERVRRRQQLTRHNIKACGELALPSMLEWLASRDSDKPFYAFINYMETHAPLIPPEEYRRRLMTPEQVRKSYQVDRRTESTWEYVFGLREYTSEENELTAATYDAALLELDDIGRILIETLSDQGYLDNTVVVIVGDHGEHLGEHHMLDHQYSVYEQLMRVPLIIHYPARFTPGCDARPVMNIDLFPTLLELAGLKSPVPTVGVNLLDAPAERIRLGEYPIPMSYTLKRAKKKAPALDTRLWNRSLRAFYHEPYKFIQGSDGRHELYNLAEDPGELNNLLREIPDVARRLERELLQYLAGLSEYAVVRSAADTTLDPDRRAMLEQLGYAVTEEENDAPSSLVPETLPASRPAGAPDSRP